MALWRSKPERLGPNGRTGKFVRMLDMLDMNKCSMAPQGATRRYNYFQLAGKKSDLKGRERAPNGHLLAPPIIPTGLKRAALK